MTATPRSLVLLAVICLAGFDFRPANAQSGVPLWTNRYVGGGSYNDLVRALAMDAQGNAFVAGYSFLGSFATSDYLTVGYSGAGVPLWTNRFDASGEDVAAAVAVDRAGNVLVTGRSSGGASGLDYATVKYSGVGVPVWTNRYDGSAGGSDQATAIAVDTNGNAFVTGSSYGNSGNPDLATLAYSSTGVPLWTNRYNGSGNGGDYGQAVAVDAEGNVIVTGFSVGSGSGTDFATIKYSNAGAELWVRRYNGPGNSSDEAHALAVDASGNVFVSGFSFGVGSSFDYATVKYSSAGVALWTNRYDGPGSGADAVQAIGLDTNGNVYVTGYSAGSSGYYDYATVAYASAGGPLWTNRYSGPGNAEDSAQSLAVDTNGNVFVTGYSTVGVGNRDFATVAYSSAGVPLWTNRYDGPAVGSDEAYATAADRYGNIFVAGNSPGNDGSFDYATIKYASVIPSPIPLQIQRAGDKVALTWDDTRFALQSSPAVAGPYTNIPTATSPYTNPASGSRQFFRLKAD